MKKYLLVCAAIIVLCSCSDKYAGLFENINKSALVRKINIIHTRDDYYMLWINGNEMNQQGERKGNIITVVEGSTKLLYDFDADYSKVTVTSNMNQVETYIRSK